MSFGKAVQEICSLFPGAVFHNGSICEQTGMASGHSILWWAPVYTQNGDDFILVAKYKDEAVNQKAKLISLFTDLGAPLELSKLEGPF